MADQQKCYVECMMYIAEANRVRKDAYSDDDCDDDGNVQVSFAGVAFVRVPAAGEEVVFYPNAERGGGQNGEPTIFGTVQSVRHQTTQFSQLSHGSIGSAWVTLTDVEVR